jgi:hypothetical protein
LGSVKAAMNPDCREVLENEWYLVRYSGETPEIALHSAIYFLTRAKDGPHLDLSDEQRRWLQAAAEERFAEIILRDLLHENSTTSAYRGPLRSIINYNRFLAFCGRQELDASAIRLRTAASLRTFLEREVAEVGPQRPSLINCSYRQLADFAAILEIDTRELPASIAALCATIE